MNEGIYNRSLPTDNLWLKLKIKVIHKYTCIHTVKPTNSTD